MHPVLSFWKKFHVFQAFHAEPGRLTGLRARVTLEQFLYRMYKSLVNSKYFWLADSASFLEQRQTVTHRNSGSGNQPKAQIRGIKLGQCKENIALWKRESFGQDRGFSYLTVFTKCGWLLPKSEGRTHKKDTTTDTGRKKLTLVIWTPKLEGFAFNTSAENVTSQRKKESKNITRVEERKKKNQQPSKHY